MPGDDERLEHLLRDAAREPTLDGVAEGVHAKWSRRRTIRRVERAALAGALAASLVVVGVVALDTTREKQHVTVAPARGAIPVVRVDGEALGRGAVTSVRVEPDEGYVRGPLLASGDRVAMAAYDRDGTSFTFPPSRIVRVEADGTVVDRVDLQGEILSLADGEGARWALTHDKEVIGPEDPEFRVKRISADGTITSNAVPPGEQPVGRIIAAGGAVWLPVSDGVLRFDTATGAFASKVVLALADRRAVVASGKCSDCAAAFVSVTVGNQQLRLDPGRDVPVDVLSELPAGVEIVDAASPVGSGRSFVLAQQPDGAWIVSDGESEITLPDDFEANAIVGGTRVVWVEGSRAGVPTRIVIDPLVNRLEVARTVRFDNTSDAFVTFTSPRDAFIVSAGSAYRVKLPQ